MARRAGEPVEIRFDKLVHEADLAYLIRIDDQEHRILKSLCAVDEENCIVEAPE